MEQTQINMTYSSALGWSLDKETQHRAAAARAKWQDKTSAPITDAHGIGYCYSCGTYCFGDCGDYQPLPTRHTMARELEQASDEMNCGKND